MALKYFDGFEGYNSTTYLFGLNQYTFSGSIGWSWTGSTRHGEGYAMNWDYATNDVNAYLGFTLPEAITGGTVYYGCAINVKSFQGTKDTMYTDSGFKVQATASGWTFVYPGGSFTTPSGIRDDNNWYYIEMKFDIGTNGNYEFRVDNRTWDAGTYTGTVTQLGQLRWTGSITSNFGGAGLMLDDWYIADSTGTLNNTFLGDVIVRMYVPDADSSTYKDGIGSDGNQTDNYALIDEGRSVSTSDYVEATGTTSTDTYEFTDVPSTSIIRGVRVSALLNKDSGGSIDAYGHYKTSSSNGDIVPYGNQYIVQQSHEFVDYYQELNPDTSGLWTPSALNATEFGIRTEEV